MHIALLVDCENAKADTIDGILGELAEKGTINIRRAYGDWKNQAGWETKLHPFAERINACIPRKKPVMRRDNSKAQ